MSLPAASARPAVISVEESAAELVRRLEWQLRLPAAEGGSRRPGALRSVPADPGFVAGRPGADDRLTPDQQLRLQAEVTRNMAEGVLIVRTSDWTIVHANPKLAELFGYRIGELEGRAVETLTPAGTAGAMVPHAPVQAALRAYGRFNGEIENVRKDGTIFWSQVNISNVEHPVHGEVSVAVHADITAEKTARDALEDAEERFRRAFQDAGAGMALVGVRAPDVGRLLQANHALAEITGLTCEDLQRRRLDDLFHPDDVAAAHRLPLADDDEPSERRLCDVHGRAVWVLLSTSLVSDAAGVPLHRLVHVRDISDRKRFEGQLQRMADHDALTGLYNRRRFEDELVRALAAAERYGRGGAVLAVDLDHLAFINDSLGHTAGDALIVRVARLLQQCLRSSDIVARVGGDAFAIVLPHADEHEARRVCDLLLMTVRAARTEDTPGARHLSVSIGVAVFNADAGAVAGRLAGEALLMQADVAMYEAKQAGRDRVALFDASSGRQAEMRAHLTWAERLRDALESDAFVLHAQPIVGLDAGGPAVYELLLRLQDRPGPPILPGAFLHVAERTNLIVDIDRWVVRRAVALMAENEQAGRDVRLHVNLSARSVNDPDMAGVVVRAITDAGVDPSRLVFEVTETVAIVNLDQARRFASRLHRLGCHVALDDFGSGFASFVYLRGLDFGVLKIDGELIRDLADSLTDQLLVKAIVEMARGLGKITIAEFVEDEQTVELLRGWGVDFVQGFHVGLPAALDTYFGCVESADTA